MIVRGEFYEVETIPIERHHVGYLFRVEKEIREGEEKDWGHAGCILPYGRVVAFGYPSSAMLEANALQAKFEKGLQGIVCFDDQLPEKYTVVEKAIRSGYQSLLIIIETDLHSATVFNDFWSQSPGKYNQYTRNCSTVCYNAFRAANLIDSAWIPIITPRRLFDMILKTCQRRNIRNYQKNGFVGFKSLGDGRNSLMIARKKPI